MASILEGINRTKVETELLIEVVQMHAGMAAEDRAVFEVRALRIFELLKSKGLRARRIAGLATAIDFRLTALARLRRDSALRGRTMPRPETDAVSISSAVLEAAAKEPNAALLPACYQNPRARVALTPIDSTGRIKKAKQTKELRL